MAIDWASALHSTGAGAATGSAAGPWGAAIGAGIGAVGNIVSQLFTNKANADLQRESWDKMSISSRVKELEANGLNKLAAISSMPSYSLSTTMKSPDVNVGAVIDAYQSAKQIQQMDINTQNLKLQNEILRNNYSSSKSQAIIDLINQKIAEGDYGIITGRQDWNIRSNDNQNLQDVGFALKATGLSEKGDKNIMQRIIENLTGYDAKDARIKELQDELNAVKGGYDTPAEYDEYLWDRPEYKKSSDGLTIHYDVYQHPYVERIGVGKDGKKYKYRDYNFN